MTKELFEEYKKLFILCLEAAGQKTGDPLLQNIERNLDRSTADELVNRIGLENLTAKDLASLFLSSVLIPEDLIMDRSGEFDLSSAMMNLPKIVSNVSSKAAEIYDKYLNSATLKFCKKYNLSTEISKIDSYGKKL